MVKEIRSIVSKKVDENVRLDLSPAGALSGTYKQKKNYIVLCKIDMQWVLSLFHSEVW